MWRGTPTSPLHAIYIPVRALPMSCLSLFATVLWWYCSSIVNVLLCIVNSAGLKISWQSWATPVPPTKDTNSMEWGEYVSLWRHKSLEILEYLPRRLTVRNRSVLYFKKGSIYIGSWQFLHSTLVPSLKRGIGVESTSWSYNPQLIFYSEHQYSYTWSCRRHNEIHTVEADAQGAHDFYISMGATQGGICHCSTSCMDQSVYHFLFTDNSS